MNKHPTRTGRARTSRRLLILVLAVGWQKSVWAGESGEAAPGGGCAALLTPELQQQCFDERAIALIGWVGQNMGPSTVTPVASAKGSTARVPKQRVSSTPANVPPVGTVKKHGEPSGAAAPAASATTTKASAQPTGPAYSGPPLSTLEAWASEVITQRDALEKEGASANPAELERMKLTAMRTVGLILTIAGNCKGARPESGRASCADADVLSERVLERWVGMKNYKKLAQKLKELGWADWQANAIFALAAQAHADIQSLHKRMGDVEDSLLDEKLKAVIHDEVLPAAQTGLPELQAVLQKLPNLQRAEVMLLVLRAALPGARKRPEAHLVIIEPTAVAPLSSVAADAKRHFLFALKQVLTATTGTDVCDGAPTGRGCNDGAHPTDAELHLEFTSSSEKLEIVADLRLANSGVTPPGVFAGKKARPVAIALGKSKADCEDDEVASRAVTAAWSLMKELEWSYNNILGDVPHMGIAERDLGRPLHQGVQVDELSATSAAVTHEGAVALVGTCKAGPFTERLRARLAGGFGLALVDGPPPSGGLNLTLTAELTDLEPLRSDPNVLTGALEAAYPSLVVNRWCLAQLSQEGRSLYRALVYVRDGTLGPEAGSDLGTYLGSQLGRYAPRPVAAAPVPVPPPPPPPPPHHVTSSGWYAIAFAGAPYIQDSRASTASKVIPSLLDGGLLIGAGVSFGLAVKYRNQYADDPSAHSMQPATVALNAGIGLAIAWFGVRLASGANYALFDYWQRSDP